jgi:hypothetical protein
VQQMIPSDREPIAVTGDNPDVEVGIGELDA